MLTAVRGMQLCVVGVLGLGMCLDLYTRAREAGPIAGNRRDTGMEDLVKTLRSLSINPPLVDSLSLSSEVIPSNQVTRLDNGLPVVAPLDTLDQVLSWHPGYDELCVSSVPLRDQGKSASQKMIICHDMMGGYINDRFIQGTSCLEDYYFYHWQYIEAFMYFSHHFITLPPPAWTNVAHRHGVLSMGTVITEWKDGASLCHGLLSDELKVAEFAHQLVAMAEYYNFDGWLVNIENNIHPVLMERLYMLLSLLTTGMHNALPKSRVIWYDSVMVNGQLKWQNQLNQFNKPFFDMCDGIFLNYNWNEQVLASSRALANDRSSDVYVGIDVFGRGCYGGGGFNSCKALEVIHRQGLSSAVFAPGWVFETQDKAEFFSNQDRFWSLLSPFCDTTIISGLPLVTSFGRGFGHKLAIDGKIVYGNQWCNHSAQDLQPSFTHDIMFKNDPESAIKLQGVSVDTMLSYNNGACLKLEGFIQQTSKMSKPAVARLFKTDISLASPLLVAFTYYKGSSDLSPRAQGYKYFIQLHTNGSPSRIFLDPMAVVTEDEECVLCDSGLPRSRDVPNLPGCVLAPLSGKYHQNLHQIFTGQSSESELWKTCYYVIDREELKGVQMTQVDIGFYVVPSQTSPAKQFTLTLGEIKILDPSCLSPSFKFSKITSLWQESAEVSSDKTSLSLTLIWSVANNLSDPIDHCNIYTSTIIEDKGPSTSSPWQSQLVFLGRAYGTSFRIKDLNILSTDLDKTTLSLEFRVQPVTMSRWKLDAEESPGLIVKILP